MYTCVNMFLQQPCLYYIGQYIIQVGSLYDFDTTTSMYTGSVMIVQIIIYLIYCVVF